MDIEDVNDFLLEQATGRTKEQVKADIANIKIRREEIEAIESKLAQLTPEVERLVQEKTDLLRETQDLRNSRDALNKELAKLTHTYNSFSNEIPILQAEHNALKESVGVDSANWRILEDRQLALDSLEKKLNEQKLEIDNARIANEAMTRFNTIESIKVKELLAKEREQLAIINLNKKPIHVHLREIQKILDDKKIKIDLIGVLNGKSTKG